MSENGDDRMTGDTVLLVDADPETEEKVVSTLEAEGYIVFASEGSKVSAEIAEKFRPALIFLRPLSPNAAGFAVCRMIHTIEALRDVPIVILASLKGPIDPRFTDYYGIVDFLRLTFSAEELLEKTAVIVGSRQNEKTAAAAEQTAAGEEEVSPAQEVSYAGAKSDHEEETVLPATAEVRTEPERVREEWHSEGKEELARDDRSSWGDERYATQHYGRTQPNKSSIRKGAVFLAMVLVAVIAAGTVLYFGYIQPENPVSPEVIPSREPEKPQDVAGTRPDEPPSEPASSSPAPIQSPESASPSPAKAFYAAQIGAFKTERVAGDFAQKFRSKGYEAYVQKGSAKDSSVVYRVLIGSFEKRKEAVKLAGTIASKERIKTTVFQGQ